MAISRLGALHAQRKRQFAQIAALGDLRPDP